MKLSYCPALLSLIKYQNTSRIYTKLCLRYIFVAYSQSFKCVHISLTKAYINEIKRANREVCKRLANHHFKLHVSSIHRIRVWPVLNTFDLQTYMFQKAQQKPNELNYTITFRNQLRNTLDSNSTLKKITF